MLHKKFVFLLVHAVIFALLFALRFFGIAADIILVIAASVIAMEAIYMAVFTKEAAIKAFGTVKEMEAEMIQLRETASETVKLQRALLYAGHQIKNIQLLLDILKKRGDFKTNGNGHQRRIHHPMVSHS